MINTRAVKTLSHRFGNLVFIDILTTPRMFGWSPNLENTPPSGESSRPGKFNELKGSAVKVTFQSKKLLRVVLLLSECFLQPFPGVDQHEFVQIRARVDLRRLDQAAVLIQQAPGNMKQGGSGKNI